MKLVELAELRAAISAPRISTYDRAMPSDQRDALELYTWNAQVSAAFMLPLHFVEVLTRNAAADALQSTYGSQWQWSPGFEQSLPKLKPGIPGYSPRSDLIGVRKREPTAGKVIPELKFVFWQKMFTARYDQRLWDPFITTLFPHASGPARVVRQRVYDHLEHIRKFRNRVAHHEPIFNRNLAEDLDTITDLIGMRSDAAAAWLDERETVSGLLLLRPTMGVNDHATRAQQRRRAIHIAHSRGAALGLRAPRSLRTR